MEVEHVRTRAQFLGTFEILCFSQLLKKKNQLN